MNDELQGPVTGEDGMNSQPFESMLRWAGAPDVCLTENLPAFESFQDLQEFLDKNAPGVSTKKVWLCTACNRYHARTSARDPSGGSSGTGRHSK